MAANLCNFFPIFILCLIFLRFASSCIPSNFSCGNFSTTIKPPFYTTSSSKTCRGIHMIHCTDKNKPLIRFNNQGNSYVLKNISYSEHSILVQDQNLIDPPWGSKCSFFYQSVTNFTIYNLSLGSTILNSELQYFNCESIKINFTKEFNLQYRQREPCKDYNVYVVQELDGKKLPESCFPQESPMFEWKLSYNNQNGNLSLLSAGFSHHLELQLQCFNCQVIGDSCSVDGASWGSACPEEKNSHRLIIIAVAAAIGGAVLFSTIFLYVFQQKKRWKRSPLVALLRASSSEPASKKDLEIGGEYPTQTFSYGELEEATDGFSASQELGDGGFGTVYKGKLRDGRTVAVKRLYQNNYKRMEQFINEIHILSLLRHQNLVTLYGCSSRQSRELLLVYEYIPNGTVADHLHGPRAEEGALTWPIRLRIAIETADALAYLHAIEPQIIHRDVKTTNILLDTSFHVKVADFGLSRLFPVDVTHVSTAPQGTPGYVDPEYHQCYQLTDRSDVYSFGVVLVELISSKPAVDISRHRHEINLSNMAVIKIQNNELDQLVDPMLGYGANTEVKRMITQVAELAFRCLQSDREMRPPIKEVFEVLRAIENGGKKEEKKSVVAENDAAISRKDAPLLKSLQRFSPDSVQDWLSSSSTITADSSG